MEATPESSADIVQETTPAHTLTPSKPSNALSKLVEGDSDTDNDELPVPAPRSKLVERLQPQIAGDTLESDSDSSSDNGDAYERVRKMLMEDAKKTDTPKVPEEVGYGTESVSSDDEDMPVRTTDARRRRMQQQKDTTPVTSHASSVHSRASSPGLFVTPDASPAAKGTANKSAIEGDREDLAAGHQNNPDLEERVRRIRAERLAKQELERTQKQSKKSARQTREGSDSDSDGENGRRLTQQSRPTRRAGKKAMADIAREQQRISRNMQLTHQAKTKKKYGVNDLFSKFGLAKVDSELVPAPAMPTPDASSALASSDAEGAGQHDTPPTSPLTQEVDNTKEVDTTVVESVEQEGKVRTPSLSTTDTALPKLDKGKGRAPEFQHVLVNPLIEQSRPSRQDHGAGHVKDNPAAMVELSDSDDDLEIEKPHRLSVFDKIPLRKQRESSSMLRLRHLAHLHSPEKKGRKGQNAMTMAELRLSLAQKARQQAQKEREEKIEELRRRGIHIETEEERERHQLEIEDMVAQLEKSREEDRKLAKLEKDEARKAGVKLDELPSSDESEDEDYVASGDEAATNDAELEEAEIELSGSEEEMDEAEDADDEEMGEEDQQGHDDLLDNVAEESGEETAPETAPHEDPEDADEEDEIHAPRMRRPRQRARKVIVEEDGESDNEPKHPSTPIWTGALPSQSQNDDDMAAFGGFDSAAKGLGLTQMFAGTMADYATASQNAHPLDTEPEQDSLDYLRILPDTQPSDAPKEASDTLVPNSQTPVSQQKDMPFSLGISQLLQSTPTFTQTQASEAFEPTQDAGFELPRSPAGLVPPTSTVETVALTVAESPVVKKRNRLHRRKPGHQAEFSDLDEDVQDGNSVSEVVEESAAKENAFAVMSKASKKQKQIDNFNKKTSWARDAIEEQAEESEDEYAGIGGASDEESGDDDEVLAELIDTNEVKVDERKIAAYYAEKAKAEDEKNINKLYKDLMNGGLRKRANGDAFDLSDSEDEAEQRRRKRRMEHAQMTRALLADERVGKLAQNPKQAAFFRTLADHFEDPEYEFLDAPEMQAEAETSPSQSDEGKESEAHTAMTVPDSQIADITVPDNPLKRKLGDSQEKENRPPPHLRRTAAATGILRKPLTVADVQHSVAELLEDPRVMVPDSQLSDSESDLEIEPPKPASRRLIIDRLGKSHAAAGREEDAEGHLAFHAPAIGVNQPGFRLPSLLRRATTGLSSASTSTSGTTTPVEGSGVRRGGTGRSNIHAQAREAERRAALEKVEKQRKATLKKKVVKARGQRSVLGCLDGGFD